MEGEIPTAATGKKRTGGRRGSSAAGLTTPTHIRRGNSQWAARSNGASKLAGHTRSVRKAPGAAHMIAEMDAGRESRR